MAGPFLLAGLGLGMVIAPVINTGTFGVALRDAGAASSLTARRAAARLIGRQALTGLALSHGYDAAFWWIAGGAVTTVQAEASRERAR